MSKRRAKPIQLAPWASAIVGNIDWTSLGDDPMGDMQIFAGATSQEALQQRLRGEVESELAAMLDAIQECDAFDVIELIRLRELPVVPVAALVDGHDGNGAAIDLVSLVCLSRPSRMPSGKDRQSTEPHHAISDLHARATRLLRLGTFMHSASSALAADDPLARLASEYLAQDAPHADTQREVRDVRGGAHRASHAAEGCDAGPGQLNHDACLPHREAWELETFAVLQPWRTARAGIVFPQAVTAAPT